MSLNMLAQAETARPSPGGPLLDLRVGEPALAFDLGQEAERLREYLAEVPVGHTAHTLLKHPDLRVVMLALGKGSCVSDHRADACVTLLALQGQVRVLLPGRIINLSTGDFLALERDVPHQLEAIADSVLLLQLASPGARATH